MSLIGIDLGTSGVKAAAFADDGRFAAGRAERAHLKRPRDGRVVTDIEGRATVAERLLAAVASHAASVGDAVTAIGLSSAGEAVRAGCL
ncbi:MAG TPA: FGGY family carbohydrate kinase [Streptosporangiaceae bacterium]|nr:FGGY family carbohydrate kinase [Streptosporangiaceae bacterium]